MLRGQRWCLVIICRPGCCPDSFPFLCVLYWCTFGAPGPTIFFCQCRTSDFFFVGTGSWQDNLIDLSVSNFELQRVNTPPLAVTGCDWLWLTGYWKKLIWAALRVLRVALPPKSMLQQLVPLDMHARLRFYWFHYIRRWLAMIGCDWLRLVCPVGGGHVELRAWDFQEALVRRATKHLPCRHQQVDPKLANTTQNKD